MILQCVSNDEELDIEPLKGVMTPLRSSQLLFQLQSPMRDPAFNGFLVERRYAEAEEFLVQNPRSQYVKLFPSDVCQLPQYEGMNSWFRDNVSSYISHKHNWSSHVPPQRVLYIYGQRGMGRALNIANLCRQARVNFLFVRRCDDESIFPFIVKKAKSMAPCLILFDDATYIAESKTKPFISSLEAAFNAYLDVRSDDVWMVFTAHANPGLLYDKGFDIYTKDPVMAASFEAICIFLKQHGSVTYVPVIQVYHYAREIVTQFLKNATKMPFIDEHVWGRTLDHMARCAMLCTIQEVNDFIVKTMQLHYVRNITAPLDPQLFEERMALLSTVNSRSDAKVMSSRLVESDDACYTNNARFIRDLKLINFIPNAADTPSPPPTPIPREQAREQERQRRSAMTSNSKDEFNFMTLPPPQPQSLSTPPPHETVFFLPEPPQVVAQAPPTVVQAPHPPLPATRAPLPSLPTVSKPLPPLPAPQVQAQPLPPLPVSVPITQALPVAKALVPRTPRKPPAPIVIPPPPKLSESSTSPALTRATTTRAKRPPPTPEQTKKPDPFSALLRKMRQRKN